MRLGDELTQLEKVRFHGRDLGYGNCIQYLQHAWMKELISQGISKATAAKAVGLSKAESNMGVLAEDYEPTP